MHVQSTTLPTFITRAKQSILSNQCNYIPHLFIVDQQQHVSYYILQLMSFHSLYTFWSEWQQHHCQQVASLEITLIKSINTFRDCNYDAKSKIMHYMNIICIKNPNEIWGSRGSNIRSYVECLMYCFIFISIGDNYLVYVVVLENTIVSNMLCIWHNLELCNSSVSSKMLQF